MRQSKLLQSGSLSEQQIVQHEHEISESPQSAEKAVVLMVGVPQMISAVPVILFPSNKRTSVENREMKSLK